MIFCVNNSFVRHFTCTRLYMLSSLKILIQLAISDSNCLFIVYFQSSNCQKFLFLFWSYESDTLCVRLSVPKNALLSIERAMNSNALSDTCTHYFTHTHTHTHTYTHTNTHTICVPKRVQGTHARTYKSQTQIIILKSQLG